VEEELCDQLLFECEEVVSGFRIKASEEGRGWLAGRCDAVVRASPVNGFADGGGRGELGCGRRAASEGRATRDEEGERRSRGSTACRREWRSWRKDEDGCDRDDVTGRALG
jgi:hypothetical protein